METLHLPSSWDRVPANRISLPTRGSSAGWTLLFGLIFFLSAPTTGVSQTARYELGKRLRSFEEALETESDLETRRVATDHLDAAVRCFFRFRLRRAARFIDRGTMALRGGENPARLWVASLRVGGTRAVLDVKERSFDVKIEPFYDSGESVPDSIRLRWVLRKGENGTALAVGDFPVRSLPAREAISVPALPEGDYRIEFQWMRGSVRVWHRHQTLSIVQDARSRVYRIGQEIAGLASDVDSSHEATLREHRRTLEHLVGGTRVLETDIPALQLLRDAESMLLDIQKTDSAIDRSRSGNFWYTFDLSGRRVPCRLYLPEGSRKVGSRPLVIALHGVGGSENMFFDTYGAGKIVTLCRDRGWGLLCPRLGIWSRIPVALLIQSIVDRFGVDPEQIFLLGHSMGAGHALSAVKDRPGLFRAVGFLSVRGSARSGEKWLDLPMFLATADRDFSRSPTLSFYQELLTAGSKSVHLREYNAEHLAVVQLCLPDLFLFFDAVHNGHRYDPHSSSR